MSGYGSTATSFFQKHCHSGAAILSECDGWPGKGKTGIFRLEQAVMLQKGKSERFVLKLGNVRALTPKRAGATVNAKFRTFYQGCQ